MATQTIEFEAPSGLTLTVRLFLKGSDTIAYTASSVTEQTNRKGIYQAIFSNVSDNLYQLIAASSGIGVASWWGYVKNSNATYQFGQKTYAGDVWDIDHKQHLIANSFGKIMDILFKANLVVEGIVTGTVTPTTTQFSSDVAYPTGAFKHSVLLWVNGSTLSEQNSPILTYTNTNGVILVEEPFTQAPSVGDTFIIIPSNHVHSISAIADGVRTELAVELARIDSPISSVCSEVGVSGPIGDICGTTLRAFQGETRTYEIDVSDANGNPYDFSGLDLIICIERDNGTNLEIIENGSITISGNTVEFETSLANNSIGQHRWSLRRTDTDVVILFGDYVVRRAALA